MTVVPNSVDMRGVALLNTGAIHADAVVLPGTALEQQRAQVAALVAALDLAIPKLTKKPLAAAKRLLSEAEKKLADIDEVLAAL